MVVTIYADGSRHKDGSISWGFVVTKTIKDVDIGPGRNIRNLNLASRTKTVTRVVHREYGNYTHGSSNMAEYMGVVLAMDWALKNCSGCDVEINTDSDVLLKQISGDNKCRKSDIMNWKNILLKQISVADRVFTGFTMSKVDSKDNKAHGIWLERLAHEVVVSEVPKSTLEEIEEA